REFARREGIGYQVLMKQWLEERLREEAAAHLAKRRETRRQFQAKLESELHANLPSSLQLDSTRQSPVTERPNRAA
ncbi:MAG: hypothetical protein AAF658_19575, partial [Myxococcota bacterium]